MIPLICAIARLEDLGSQMNMQEATMQMRRILSYSLIQHRSSK
jgi:hypothetical protein